MGWEFVLEAGALAAGQCHGTEVGGEYVAVYNLDGRFFATSDICTHQVALLSGGRIEGDCIECPMHQGRFHIPTGAPRAEPATEALKTYPVKVENDKVYVFVE